MFAARVRGLDSGQLEAQIFIAFVCSLSLPRTEHAEQGVK